MVEGTSGSRRTRSQVAPEWTINDCLILVNEIAAVEADFSNALSSFQKWTMISENCNALDVHRTLNQCRRKWDSLVSDYKQIKQWESQGRGSGRSYLSLSTEKKKKLNLPGNIDNELLEAINAVVMIQEDKAGTEPDSDPEAQDVVDATAVLALAGSKRSRQRTMVIKQNVPNNTRKEEEPRTNQIYENIQEKRVKLSYNHKTREKKTVEEISTDDEEEEVEAMEVKLSNKFDLIHAIVGRSLAQDNETEDGVSIDKKLKFVRQQADELNACLSEIVSTLNRLKGVPQEFK